jgi:CBS domain containing-hemolysin-like protein
LRLVGEQTVIGAVTGSDNRERAVELPEDIDDYEQEWAEKPLSALEQDRRTITQVMVPRERVHTLDLARHPDDNLFAICEVDHRSFPVIDSGGNRG